METYLEALGQFGRYLAEAGMPTGLWEIDREHVEAYIVDLQQRVATRARRAR